ncbi:MAG: DUF1573 domain-containing protein [Chitinophagales bacterium]
MKTFFELLVIAATLFIFTACSQSSANEVQNKSVPETVTETVVNSDEGETAEVENIPKTTMTFASMIHDFGNIEEGEKVLHVFTFTNSGDEPLIINSAEGSCGCTIPDWPKEPIAPGMESNITIEFNSKGKAGNQTKTVTINANTDPNPTRLTIKAQVAKAESRE